MDKKLMMKEEQKRLRMERKAATREVRNKARKKQRILHRVNQLSQDDLVLALHMRLKKKSGDLENEDSGDRDDEDGTESTDTPTKKNQPPPEDDEDSDGQGSSPAKGSSGARSSDA